MTTALAARATPDRVASDPTPLVPTTTPVATPAAGPTLEGHTPPP
jgi:hypothetical protein